MGRNARREAIVKLREQIDACDNDPKMLVSLTRQLNKLLPPKKKAVMGRPRNETPTRKTLAKDAAALEAQSTFKPSDFPGSGEWLASLTMGKREFWRLILGIENERLRRVMTKAEEVAFEESMVASFSHAERAALEAYDPWEGLTRPDLIGKDGKGELIPTRTTVHVR